MRKLACRALLLLLPLVAGCASRPGGDDLESYIATIRAERMTESARGMLMTVTAIRTKWTLLTLEKDEATGFYMRSYDTSTCGLPGADPKKLEAQKQELMAATEREARRLQPLADLDGSGFVTTEEGSRFRQLYELALIAAHVCEQEECAVATLAKATGRPPATVEESLAGFRTLAQRAGALRIADFPAPAALSRGNAVSHVVYPFRRLRRSR
jgi:hypothetical protein